MAYPKVDVEVADRARFSIGNLIRDGHLVVRVEVLEEALAGMRPQQDRVRIAEAEETEDGQKEGKDDSHFGVVVGC
jgi:hypothetical protein